MSERRKDRGRAFMMIREGGLGERAAVPDRRQREGSWEDRRDADLIDPSQVVVRAVAPAVPQGGEAERLAKIARIADDVRFDRTVRLRRIYELATASAVPPESEGEP